MKRSLVIAIVLSAFAALAAAGSAGAAVSCTYDSSTHKVTLQLTASGDSAAIGRTQFNPSAISSSAGACGAGTTANTDQIDIVDKSAGGTEVHVNLDHGGLAPGLTPEPGTSSEIEIHADLGAGFDALELDTDQNGSKVVAGSDGVNLNADKETAPGSGVDPDLTVTGADLLELVGRDGPDVLSGAGGAGTGAALTTETKLVEDGSGGADTLVGGDGSRDIIAGRAGADDVHAGAGDDVISGGDGDDKLDGQAGSDQLSYLDAAGPVHVNLGAAGPQATGQGTDTIAGVESLGGSDFDDTLTGDGGPNSIAGEDGADTLSGAGGDDVLLGGDGSDTENGGAGSDIASYQGSPSGVTVDLSKSGPQDTGGSGTETLSEIENLRGSDSDDHLTGDASANVLDGRFGADTLVGGDGIDTLDAGVGDDHLHSDDSVADKDLCGPGNDDVTADGLDVLDSCEPPLDPSAPGTPDPSGGNSGSGSGTSSSGPQATPLTLTLSPLRPSRFPAARTAAGAARRGAQVRYTLSAPAKVTFRVERAKAGRRVNGRCVRPTASDRRAKRCTRWARVRGSLTRQGAAGTNVFRFSGRIGGRRLRPGAYRLVAVARDSSGAASKPARARFRIAR
jgi:Ca2+-binding RTX toxin-like protein